MKKIYQTIIDQGRGNCMQAAIATMIGRELEDTPSFDPRESQFEPLHTLMGELGYKYTGGLYNKHYNVLCHNQRQYCFEDIRWHKPSILTKANLRKHAGYNGMFYASVLSPNFFDITKPMPGSQHAVIIDHNFNILHDPNPEYIGIKRYPMADLLGCNGIVHVWLFDPK